MQDIWFSEEVFSYEGVFCCYLRFQVRIIRLKLILLGKHCCFILRN